MARLYEIVEHGHDRQDERDDHDGPGQHEHGIGEGTGRRGERERVLEKEQHDGDDLEHRLEFSIPTCRNNNSMRRHKHSKTRNNELTSDYEQRNP